MRQLRILKQVTNRDSESLDKYLQEIGKEDLLTAEEEVELAQKIRNGDNNALDKLVRGNLRFVVSVSKQYQNQGLSLPDLINEGNLGLIKAAQRFDETRGFKFISYAVWWIRQSILQAVAEQSRIVRLPLNKIGSINKINKVLSQLEQEFEREPLPEEIAKVLEIQPEEVKNALKIANRYISMDAPFQQDDNEGSLYDVVPNKENESPDKELLVKSLQKEIQRALSTLSPRESEILKMCFGLNETMQFTLDEIGQKFDLTPERVRQIKEKSIKKLKKTSRSKNLKMYLG